MKKIIFVRFKQTAFGGAENYLSRILQAAKNEGIACEVFSTGDFGQPPSLRPKIPTWLPTWLRVYLFARAFRRWRGQNPEMLTFSLERVFGCDIYRAGDGVHKRWLEIKNAASPLEARKTLLNPLHALYLKLESSVFKKTNLIIANSSMIKQEIIATYGTPAERITVIHNGIPLPEQINKTEAKATITKEWGIPPNTRIILFVGSGFERKGVREALMILKACADLPFCAFFIGKEKRLHAYKLLAQELEIAQRCHFLGPRSDTARFYEAADIFLFPTHYEPFSNATLEAMAYGCALISTQQNGVAEILPDPAFILPRPQAISEGAALLRKLLDDEAYLRQNQQLCYERSKAFSIEKNLSQTLQAIHENFN